MSNDKSSPNKQEKRRKSKKKNKKKSSVLYKFLKVTVLLLLLIIFTGAALGLGTAYAWIKEAKPLDYDAIFDLNQTTYIVDKEDRLIDKLHANENRTMVTLDQIPKKLQDAFIAIEDKRFNDHNGIDPYRILGAVRANFKTGELTQGGSTITQQLIKLVYLSPDKLFKRKITEWYYAIQLERRYTKDQILEAYLNRIDFSSNVSGVKEASLYYFGKELDKLSLAETAMLAGITNNPSLYSPYRSIENATKRQRLILKEMLRQEMINQHEYDTAFKEEIVLTKVESEVETGYFTDMVIRDVTKALVTELGLSHDEAQFKIYNGGLKIITTIDTHMQTIVENAFENEELFPPGIEKDDTTINPEGAFILIENGTGEVKAVMGGRSEKVKRGLNRATQSLRQPGSSLKPLSVYTPALDNGYTVGTVIDDKPINLGGYKPHNYSSRYYKGLVTLREAIQSSINTVAVQIVQDVGLSRSLDYLKRFGLTTMVEEGKSNDKGLSPLSLGALTYGVKPIEIAAAYSVFPNKGILIKPITFTKVLDKNDTVIINNIPIKEKVVDSKVAYLMVDIMKGVVRPGGTATRAALANFPVAGKTGTTSNYKDAWFSGYTPYYTGSVWMGFDEPTTMRNDKRRYVTGGSYPAMMWKTIMEEIHKNLEKTDFEKPEGMTYVSICTESGKRPSELCSLDPRGSTIKKELFIKGTEPQFEDKCDVHVIVDVDTESNLLVSPYCPISLIQSKVFVQRTEPYVVISGEPNPRDMIYAPPTEICELHKEPEIIDDILIDDIINIQPTINPPLEPTPTPSAVPSPTVAPTPTPTVEPSPTPTPN